MNSSGQKVRVHCASVSLDGFLAGPNQSLERPMGEHFDGMHDWMIATRTGAALFGGQDGTTGVDEDFVARSFEGVGAYIFGRHMFGPSRGPWTDDGWTGWWGPNPPYHRPTFVLTHHPRPSIPMEGGTTFHFATDGIHDTLDRAFAAADGGDVRVVGGAATLHEFLREGLVDEMHLVFVPALVGEGERLFAGPIPYRCERTVPSGNVLHALFSRIP